MEGQRLGLPPFVARRLAWLATDGRGSDAYAALLLGQRDWRRGLYPPLSRHGSGRGTAAPRSVARQALPSQQSAVPVVATSDLCRATMHGAAHAFGCARAIDAAKSVSLKKTDSVRFKIILKKRVKIKKNLH